MHCLVRAEPSPAPLSFFVYLVCFRARASLCTARAALETQMFAHVMGRLHCVSCCLWCCMCAMLPIVLHVCHTAYGVACASYCLWCGMCVMLPSVACVPCYLQCCQPNICPKLCSHAQLCIPARLQRCTTTKLQLIIQHNPHLQLLNSTLYIPAWLQSCAVVEWCAHT